MFWAVVVLLMLCGCYFNRAAFDPMYFAPTSPRTTWLPPKEPMAVEEGKVPKQKEPFTLAELIDLALKNNTQTRQTWAQARAAAAAYGQSQSDAFPELVGSFSFDRSRTPSFSPGQINRKFVSEIFLTEWGPDLNITYTIFDFGQQRATSEASRQALYFADWTHDRAIQTLINVITDDYYRYLYHCELLKSLQEDLVTAETTYKAAHAEQESGVKDLSDALQAKTRLIQTQMQYVSEQRLVQNTFASLLNDMGLPATLSFDVEKIPETMPGEKALQDVKDLLDEAYSEREDLRAAEANLRSQEKSLDAARRAYYFPTIDGSFQIGRTYFGDGKLHDHYDYNLMLSLSYPLFAGFYYKNAVRAAEATRDQAAAVLRETQLAISEQISTAQFNVKIAYERLKYAFEFLASADKQYQIMLKKYIAGTTTIIDLLSTQSALAEARAGKASSLQEWYTALANLAYATGILTVPSKNKEKP